jgi:hypothetical protein
MDNKTKQYLALLEARVLKLENIIEAFNIGMQQAAQNLPLCNQCGAYDPHKNNYVCSMRDCCQGLNPEDDA